MGLLSGSRQLSLDLVLYQGPPLSAFPKPVIQDHGALGDQAPHPDNRMMLLSFDHDKWPFSISHIFKAKENGRVYTVFDRIAIFPVS